jgi:hypothetical protein
MELARSIETDTDRRKRIAKENYLIVRQNLRLVPKTFIWRTRSKITSVLKEKNSIEFLNMNTNQAIQYYSKNTPVYYMREHPRDRNSIAVLNFANSHNAGGGYLVGAMAQEEELCRTGPFLYASLHDAKEYYNAWRDDWSAQVLYTPNVQFIRTDSFGELDFTHDNFIKGKILNDPEPMDRFDSYGVIPKTTNGEYAPRNHFRPIVNSDEQSGSYTLLPDRKWTTASVITAAAPNLHYMSSLDNLPNPTEYEDLIRQIYFTPIKFRTDNSEMPHISVLILGALGCGAFAPVKFPTYNKFIAKVFVKILSECGGHYDKICFAIPKDKSGNYDTFLAEFEKHKNNFKSLNTIN